MKEQMMSEPAINVKFSLLKDEAVDSVYEAIVDMAAPLGLEPNEHLIKWCAATSPSLFRYHEYVTVPTSADEPIKIGLAVDEIDDDAVQYGIELLSETGTSTPGTRYVGREVIITPKEILR